MKQEIIIILQILNPKRSSLIFKISFLFRICEVSNLEFKTQKGVFNATHS